VIQAESGYNPEARSPVGAVGLMQLMPDTALRYGVRVEDRTDPAESISGGARYLRDLLKMFNSDVKLAVAGYNAGENAVKKYKNSIPPYPETQNYVAQVLDFYER
jgi:soluble lytic murein transglycosylase-like protein